MEESIGIALGPVNLLLNVITISGILQYHIYFRNSSGGAYDHVSHSDLYRLLLEYTDDIYSVQLIQYIISLTEPSYFVLLE